MAYQALYRTYRPQKFSEVVGEEVVIKTLQNAIMNQKISHAYLFSGPRGIGKTSVARIFAKALNCQHVHDAEPCNECDSCKEISLSINPDVIEIDAASNNGVDEIRDIREKVRFLPSGSRYKIYIIDEVHMLSSGAFNALLKTLEEPPKHVVFILATTEPQKLPATIISRCQHFEFKSLSQQELNQRIMEVCQNENVTISFDAISAISDAAEGAMRDALSILDQVISYGSKDIQVEDVNVVTGSLNFEKLLELVTAIENKETAKTITVFNEWISSGKEASKIIGGMIAFYRDALLYKSLNGATYDKPIFEKQTFCDIAQKMAKNKILYCIDVLSDVQSKIKFSTAPNIYLEISLIKLCSVTENDLDLMNRVTALEETVASTPSQVVSSEPVNNEKVSLIDAKLNQVVSELSKLELHKWIKKIDDMSQQIPNNSDVGKGVDEEARQELQNIRKAIEELQIHYDDIKDQLDHGTFNTSENIDNSLYKNIDEKIINLKQQIDKLTNQSSNSFDYNVINSLQDKVVELENKMQNYNLISNDNNEYDSTLLEELKEKVNALENRPTSMTNVDQEGQNQYFIQLQEKVEELENRIQNSNPMSFNNNESFDGSLLEELKEKVEELENRIQNSNPISYDNNESFDGSLLEELKEKVEELENRMHDIRTHRLDDEDDNNEYQNDNQTDNESIIDLQEQINAINDDLGQIKLQLTNNSNQQYDANIDIYELKEIKEKLDGLDRKFYQLAAGELSRRNNNVKPAKKPAGQIMLFGDEIQTVEDYHKDSTKESYDFSDLEKETNEEINNEDITLNNVNQETVSEETTSNESFNSLNNNLNEEYYSKLDQEKPNLFNTNKYDEVKTNEEEFIPASILERHEQIEKEKQEPEFVSSTSLREQMFSGNNEQTKVPEEPVLNNSQQQIRSSMFEVPTPMQQTVTHQSLDEGKTIFNERTKETITNKPNSTLVIKERDRNNDDFDLPGTSILQEMRKEQMTQGLNGPDNRREEIRPQNISTDNFDYDKFATYDVKLISQLLTDTRSPEAKNDFERIKQSWRTMSRYNTDPTQSGIIETLQEGVVAAVGNKEMIIVFKNWNLCNQVMRRKFKLIALRILHQLLGDTYNYIALPQDVWTEKRAEYKRQYSMGNIPILTPINDPQMEILTEEDEYQTDKDKKIDNVIRAFGQNNIKFE